MRSKLNKVVIALIILLFVAGIIQIYYFYPLLPDRIVDHFSTNGLPDSWTTKNFFVFMDIGLSLTLVVLFITASRLPFRLPKNIINIPNPEHWLKNDRQIATVVRVSNYVLWIGVLSLLFIRTRFHHIYLINSSGPPYNSNFFWMWFFLYIGAVILFTWRFYAAFQFKPDQMLTEKFSEV